MVALPITLMAADQSALVNIDLKDITIEQGIASLFAKSGYKYTIDPGITGRIVELKLKGITFDQALIAFLQAADLTYELKNNVYHIKPNPQPSKATTTIVAQGSPRAAAQPKSGKAVPYPQQPAEQNQNQQVASLPNTGQVNPPTQQVNVNQQAPVFYGQPSAYPGYCGYPSNFYRVGNLGILGGGCGTITVFGGYPYVTTFGTGPLPPEGYVSPDQLRFLRTIKAITPGLYVYGPGY